MALYGSPMISRARFGVSASRVACPRSARPRLSSWHAAKASKSGIDTEDRRLVQLLALLAPSLAPIAVISEIIIGNNRAMISFFEGNMGIIVAGVIWSITLWYTTPFEVLLLKDEVGGS